ncbi:MAG: hypothetical protein ACI37O_04310 [Candidatus Avelusimicrobium sp.]|uniref:hypothetical protein n=1 Tax=Candidatus Avelusimicrobium sp. TaxID=3048833 RepID=UPI003F01A7BC
MSAKKNQNQKEKDLDTELRDHAQNDGKGETAPILDSGSTPGMTAEEETASTLDCGSGGAQRPGMTAEKDCGAGGAQRAEMTAEEETKQENSQKDDGNAKNEPAKEKLSNSALAARLRFLACNFRALRDRAVMRQELKDLLERC